MEKWKTVLENSIPIGKYQVALKNGEELGLIIELESDTHLVKLDFGVVSAMRMLDEGTLLNEVFSDKEISEYKANNFSNTIYEIQNGEFDTFIKNSLGEMYEHLELRHYIVVTMNYVIEIMSDIEPDIEIKQIG